MDESILTSIKKLLGIAEDYTHFDVDITIHINSAFSVLRQIGAGSSAPFYIETSEDTWSEFTDDHLYLHMAKMYVYLRVKLAFDPPSSSAVMESMQRELKELEWRINAEVDFT